MSITKKRATEKGPDATIESLVPGTLETVFFFVLGHTHYFEKSKYLTLPLVCWEWNWRFEAMPENKWIHLMKRPERRKEILANLLYASLMEDTTSLLSFRITSRHGNTRKTAVKTCLKKNCKANLVRYSSCQIRSLCREDPRPLFWIEDEEHFHNASYMVNSVILKPTLERCELEMLTNEKMGKVAHFLMAHFNGEETTQAKTNGTEEEIFFGLENGTFKSTRRTSVLSKERIHYMDVKRAFSSWPVGGSFVASFADLWKNHAPTKGWLHALLKQE